VDPVNSCGLADVRVPTESTLPLEKCTLDSSRMLTIAFAFGVSIFVLVHAAAPFRLAPSPRVTRHACIATQCQSAITNSAPAQRSGGHINPAVTFGLLVANKISLQRAVCYIIAQLLGGLIGVGLVKAVRRARAHVFQSSMQQASCPARDIMR